ncbi:pro-adrenomedullin-like [Erpetoichthys calabaricus]|uniref:pro-adrenomedullin-like n=1 Tax=Erpetoichthys calabaricus TaxID=27687 RepID=UPI0010A062AF|nr:pro-adrenomedullin-like [Erpetoichthys calabaricus]
MFQSFLLMRLLPVLLVWCMFMCQTASFRLPKENNIALKEMKFEKLWFRPVRSTIHNTVGAEKKYIRPEDLRDALKVPVRPFPVQNRSRRAVYMPNPNRGCHLGTCQLQNLASLLYRMGGKTVKEESKQNMSDPHGYGRRRRRR